MARNGKNSNKKRRASAQQSWDDWEDGVNPNRGMKRNKRKSKRRVDKNIIRDMMDGQLDPDMFQDWNDRQY